MQIKTKSIAIAALFVVSASAYAGKPAPAPVTAVDVTPNKASFAFSAGSMTNIIYSDNNNTFATGIKYISSANAFFGNQNTDSIDAGLKTAFGLSSLPALVSQQDTASGGTSSFGTYTSSQSFEYLAIHLGGSGGGQELLFDFGSKGINSFSIKGLDHGLSNFRAFGTVSLSNSSIAAVPEPEEWALMLAGLPLIGWKLRNKKANTAQAIA
jgi:hypothetical protein